MAATMSSTEVQVGEARLAGRLEVPQPALGLVVFAHGSGSNRASPRNRYVAEVLQAIGLATLSFDLLEAAEAGDRRKVFDIPLLGARATQALDWLAQRGDTAALPTGLFGASTGAAAALCAAAARPGRVRAVVSRGGRPDLARDCLAEVSAPTLLIVGGTDTEVLRLNREALRAMQCRKRLEVVPGASHLFEEPGALDAVAHLAGAWFETHLGSPAGT